MLNAQNSEVEAALWTALRFLKERALLLEEMARKASSSKYALSEKNFHEQAQEVRKHAEVLGQILQDGTRAAENPAARKPIPKNSAATKSAATRRRRQK